MLLQQCSLRQASTPFQKSEVSCQRSADVLRIEARGDVSLMCVGGGELHGLLLQRPDYSASVLMAGQRALVRVYGKLKHLNDSTPFGKWVATLNTTCCFVLQAPLILPWSYGGPLALCSRNRAKVHLSRWVPKPQRLLVKCLDRDMTADGSCATGIRWSTRRPLVIHQRIKKKKLRNKRKGIKKLPEAKSSSLSTWWNKTCPVIQLGKQ